MLSRVFRARYIHAGPKLRGSNTVDSIVKYCFTSLRFTIQYWYWINCHCIFNEEKTLWSICCTHGKEMLPRGSVEITASILLFSNISSICAALWLWIITPGIFPNLSLREASWTSSISNISSFVFGSLCFMISAVTTPFPAQSSTMCCACAKSKKETIFLARKMEEARVNQSFLKKSITTKRNLTY